jgi:hypothetical protein
MTHLPVLSVNLYRALLLSVLGIALVLIASSSVRSQKKEDEPYLHEYRGVSIGMLASDVRKKLGSPADKGTEQDFFIFQEKETAQILYDKEGKVVTISVDFMNGANGVLTPKQVFGGDIEIQPDGSMYKLVRYPKAGCWLSYNRTKGDQGMVTVTIQKIQ